jgi:hypothetical protein
MKNVLVVFILVLITSCKFSVNTADTFVLTETNKKEIMDAIAAESNAFYQRDFNKWSAAYTKNNPSWICAEEGGVVLEAYDTDSLNRFVGGYMKANPTIEPVIITREDVKYITIDSSVYVNFIETQKLNNKSKVLRAVRLMKKENNQWKIAAMNSAFVKYE